jgi:hypothetical protein
VTDDGEQMIVMFSGVSVFTGEGFVTLRWGPESGQLSPTQCRQHALALLACADAAESDAGIWAVMHNDMGMDPDAIGTFLTRLRENRGKPGGGM